MDGNDTKPPRIGMSQFTMASAYESERDNMLNLNNSSDPSGTTEEERQVEQKITTSEPKLEVKEEVIVEHKSAADNDVKYEFKPDDSEKHPVSDAEQDNEESDDECGMLNTSGDERCRVCGKTDEETKAEAQKNDKEEGKLQMSKKKSHLVKEPEFKWIFCDHCRRWFHFSCAKIEQYEWQLYEKYFCRDCSPITGPSKFFPKHAPHRWRWYSADEKDLPIEVGSEIWIKQFIKKENKVPAPNEDEVCIVQDGDEFHSKFSELGGPQNWDKVFLVRKPNGLGMTMPPPQFDLEDVVKIMGPDFEVDTIDVFHQTTYSMKLSTFQNKFRSETNRYLLYNFLSLEFSEHEKMKTIAEPPQFVKDISLVNKLWPNTSSKEYAELLAKDRFLPEEIKPRVEQFCLAGMANSYTDFHVDFGGSSVYYHIFKGEKIFYIAPPTEENLRAYEEHETSHLTSEWFGEKINGRVKRVVISEGETLLIPAGWIHAVYTPKDSLVFGGNFLHLGNMEMQMRIYKLEMAVRKAINSSAKFYFPNFEFLHWMLMKNLMIPKIKKSVDEGSDMREVDPALWESCLFLVDRLEEWLKRELSGDQGEHDKQESEVGVEEKKRIMKTIKKLIGTQNSKFNADKRSRGGKQKRRSRDAIDDDDDDYVPSSSKKSSKTPKKEKNNEIPKKKLKAEIFVDDMPFANASIVQSAPLKLKIVAGPTEDQSNVMHMFKNQCTSSGRHVKLKQHVVELGGTHLESRLEEIPEKPTSSFQDLDKELMRCESIHSGEKLPKQKVAKVPKEPKEKKEKPPAKKKEDTSRSRLMKKLKLT